MTHQWKVTYFAFTSENCTICLFNH